MRGPAPGANRENENVNHPLPLSPFVALAYFAGLWSAGASLTVFVVANAVLQLVAAFEIVMTFAPKKSELPKLVLARASLGKANSA